MYDDEFMVSDAQDAAPVSPLVVAPEPESPGIGMDVQAPAPVSDGIGIAPVAKVPQIDLRREAIGKMGGLEKILSAIGEFGAGVTGRASPLDTRIQNERRDKLEKLQEFKVHTDALQDGVKMAQKMKGEARTQFIENYAAQLDSVRPGLGDTYRSLSKQPDLVSEFQKYMPYLDEPQKMLLQNDPDRFLTWAGTEKGMETLGKARDKSVNRLSYKKIETALMGWDKFLPPEKMAAIKKDGVITYSEFIDGQQHLPEQLRMSDAEIEAANRTTGFWDATKVVGPKDEAEVNKKRLLDGDKPNSEIGKIRADEKAGRITKAEADARIAKLNKDSSGVTINMPGSSDTVQGEDGKFYKFRIGKDGKVDAVPMQTPSGDALRPPKTASEIKADKDRGGEEATISSVRGRIKAMSDQLQSNAGIVGPAGVARRIGESAAGVVAPGVDTPALDYQNNVRLLVADVRKIVEKDPNLSNQERQNLYEMLGGGVLQTPGSAVRALNNVMGYVEGKSTHGKTREANIESSVKAAGWDFEPSKYDYRIVDGKVQRKAKGGK